MKQSPESSPVNVFQQINDICREFSKQLTRGKSPSIKKLLTRVPREGQENLFANLLGIEVNFRRSRGETPNSTEYLQRFPQFKTQVRRAFFEPSLSSVSSDFETDGEALTASHRSDPSPDASDLAPTFELPDANRLGDYKLIRWLGQGAMGVVYEARHLKTGNHVALKTLPTGGDNQQVQADRLYRFRKEFRRLSEINHPHLVGMQSLEVDGDRWFFTMDLIDGEDFLSYVRPNDRLDETRQRSCLKQLAQGVIELHRRGSSTAISNPAT